MVGFLAIPFVLLGALALVLVWVLSRFTKPTLVPRTPPESISTATSILLSCLLSVIGIAGFVLRLYGIDNSLWLDEFGTLWTVEGDFLEVGRKAFSFQGQSPFYYLIVWACIHLLGVSEIILRLPSLLFGIAAVYTAYRLGVALYNRRAGMVAASFLWIAPGMVQSSADARPYALALFMAALMFYGFARAAKTGSRSGRALFIIGAAGLFSAHYLMIPLAMGIAIGYIWFPALREKYLPASFVRDLGIQLLLVAWFLPQLVGLLLKREQLSWLGAANHLAFFELIGPFVVWTAAAFFFSRRPFGSGVQRAMTWVFVAAVAAQVAFLQLLQFLGTNLLHQRYMLVILIPAVLIATVALQSIPRKFFIVPLAYWLIFIGVAFAMNFKAYGSFSRAGFQDWRYAAACLQNLLRDEPGALVLYRSGFVEEDDRVNDATPSAATSSPLRSPGTQPASLNLIPLTYTWSKPGREGYFSRTVEPALRNVSVFYFLTCAYCFNEATGDYPASLLAWIDERFPGQFAFEPIEAGRGITLIRFIKQADDSRSPTQLGARDLSRFQRYSPETSKGSTETGRCASKPLQ
jgi:uncharacterized membrane protein